MLTKSSMSARARQQHIIRTAHTMSATGWDDNRASIQIRPSDGVQVSREGKHEDALQMQVESQAHVGQTGAIPIEVILALAFVHKTCLWTSRQ